MSRQSNKKINEVEKRIDKAIRERSVSLNLIGIGLTQLPPSLSQLSQLQRLYLANNQLATLPAWLGQLTELQLLVLDGNPLVTVPDCLVQLTQMQ